MSEFVGYLTFSSIGRKDTIIFISLLKENKLFILKENKLLIDTLNKTFLIWKKNRLLIEDYTRCNNNSSKESKKCNKNNPFILKQS